MTRTALFASAVFASTVFIAIPAAVAGPGDYKEDALRAQVVQDVEFACPKGSRRTVSESKGSLVETCVTSDGVRNGYFLKWAADGSTWMQLGSYADGLKNGKWVKFTKDGDAKRVTWYQRGRKAPSKKHQKARN